MLTALLFASAVRPFSSSMVQSPAENLRSVLQSYRSSGFNGFLYVERDGRQLFFEPVGYADAESKRPFTLSTGVEIGSIVKPISKTALLKLCAAGKLSLSDPISKFFDNVPPDKQSITVGMLANHRSGFQDVFGGDYEPVKRDDLMRAMLASKLQFEPDSKSQYSNSGYSMLAAIEEKVTGEAFENCVSRLVFRPIGLRKTGYVLPGWKKEELAVGYRSDGTRWGSPMDRFWFPDGPGWNLRGNGGMITTVPEIARWVRALHSGELLDADSYRLFAPGLAEDKVKPNSLWLMAGGNGIFDTVVAYNPSRHLVILAFSSDARFQIENVLTKQLAKPIFSLVDN